MTYDPADGCVVLVNPYLATGAGAIGTWTYAHGVWTNRTTPAGPQTLDASGGSIAYDAGLGVVLLQLSNGSAFFPTYETWEFHADNWTELFPADEPSARWGAAMAFDPELNETVLFGGFPSAAGNNVTSVTDTWVFSDGNWYQVALGPPAAATILSQTMAYDPAIGELVLVTDGLSPPVNGEPTVGTFAFTGTGWEPIGAAPEFGVYPAMTYDPAVRGLAGVGLVTWGNQTSSIGVFTDYAWGMLYLNGFPVWTPAFTYDATDGYGVMVSTEPTLNVSGPVQQTVTWKLANVSVGPLPQATIEVSPGTSSLGTSITMNGSVSDAFGHTWVRIDDNAPGCPSASNSISLSCTPQTAGTYSASFRVWDQAGRGAGVAVNFSVTQSPWWWAFGLVPYVAIGVGAAVVVGLFLLMRARRNRPDRLYDPATMRPPKES